MVFWIIVIVVLVNVVVNYVLIFGNFGVLEFGIVGVVIVFLVV